MYTESATLVTPNSRLREAAAVAFFGGLTALGAQVALPLPFSPVPITLQVLMVILSGLALGSRRGLMSQLGYVAAGALGLPVFAGGTGGLGVVLGPTGGYLMAFPLAACIAGLVSERLGRRHKAGTVVASLAAIAVIYGGGATWLAIWLSVTGSHTMGAAFTRAWYLGVRPFILVDLAKAVLAAAGGGVQAPLSRFLGLEEHQAVSAVLPRPRNPTTEV